MTTPYYYPPVMPQYRPPLPKHPRATISLVFGIISVAGFFVLIVPVFLGPLAWYFGAVAQRDIEREPSRWSGGGESKSGMILGIIGTAMILIVMAFLVLILVGMLFFSQYDSGYGS